MNKFSSRFRCIDVYKNKKNGFTIVELIVVIAIIGIIASIVIVSYGNWKTKVVETQIKSDLNGISSAMKNFQTFNNSYPSSLPSSFTPSKDVLLTLHDSSATAYCIDATSAENSSINYYIDSENYTSGAQSGTCGSRPKKWEQISVGFSHVCAIDSYDRAYCWGDNTYGQLGVISISKSSRPVAVDTTGLVNGKTVKSISTSYYSTCAITSDDQVYCWGRNNYGQLGNNSNVDSTTPVAVDRTGLFINKTIKSISAGGFSACAIASDDKAYCWGKSDHGELGNGNNVSSYVPVAVKTTGVLSGKDIKMISSGLTSSCVIASDDKAYCWGYNYNGEIGDGTTSIRTSPVAVSGNGGALLFKTIKTISLGDNVACATTSDSQTYCWGNDVHGQIGDGDTSGLKKVNPTLIDSSGVLVGKTIMSVSADQTTCAIASDDKLYCWGSSLGNGLSSDSFSPVAIDLTGALSGKTIKSISAGFSFACAIASDDKIYCWGLSDNGKLGNDVSQSLVPMLVREPL